MILHHDNARPHSLSKVVDYIKNSGFEIMEQPPYSPDLAPCDFWLFDLIKRNLSDHTSIDSLFQDAENILNSIPKTEW